MYKPFKIAQDFTVQYFGICIPKNAIYGRLTKNIYIFVDDFRQFRPNMHNCTISIHLLDIRKDNQFKKYIVKDSNIIFKLCYDFIAKNKLWDTICENNLCYRKSGVRPSWYVAPRRPSQSPGPGGCSGGPCIPDRRSSARTSERRRTGCRPAGRRWRECPGIWRPARW